MDLEGAVRGQHEPVDDPLEVVSQPVVQWKTNILLEPKDRAFVERVVPLVIVKVFGFPTVIVLNVLDASITTSPELEGIDKLLNVLPPP